MDKIYKGYELITGSTAEINDTMSSPDFYERFVPNQYLLVKNIDDGTTKEMRFDGASFVSLRLPPTKYIKGKNSLQRCALDLMNNQDITIVAILGTYGSGKTYMAMRMSLYQVKEKGNQAKVLGVRSPWGEGKQIGWLPGEFEDKTGGFFLPLVQQLEGGEFELDRLKQMGMVESNIPYFMKGSTYNDTIILGDEAEDFTEKELRLIGTRVGQKSRVFFVGDRKQSLVDATDHNPLVRMCNQFKGNPLFGCIYLDEDVRSETSKLFADLFEDD